MTSTAVTTHRAGSVQRLTAPRPENAAVRKDVVDGLTRYHAVNGESNGGGVPGTLFPPGVKTREALVKFIDEVAAFLAAQPSIQYVDFPTDPEARQRARQAYSAKEREYVRNGTQDFLRRGVAMIRSPEIRNLAEAAIRKAPPQFFTSPSSSSGRYHPADENNPGGLALHSYRTALMADMLARHFKLSDAQRDQVVAGALLHDINKGGTPWKSYAPDHGPQGRKLLDDVWTGETKTEKLIEQLVGNHMAQWNEPKPTPAKDLGNLIVSYADYLGSRDQIYVQTR